MSNNTNGIAIEAKAKRVFGKWQLELSGPAWLINDIENELRESRSFLLLDSDVYKIVLQQKLPLLDSDR